MSWYFSATATNAPGVGAHATRSVRSWYDPMVEFLEIAVDTQGKRWWKFYAPIWTPVTALCQS